MPKAPRGLLMDANVVIDYQRSAVSVLGLVNKHVGEVHVLTTILDEVDGLDVVDCRRLGFDVIEPELNQLTRAASQRGRLSFRDHLCLIVASDRGLVCVTNDKPLRKACQGDGVAISWGLEMMSVLVRASAMQAADAIQTAEQIHLGNPLHIPRSLVDRFARMVTGIEKKRAER